MEVYTHVEYTVGKYIVISPFVSILMGHADINMTAGTYYDASDQMIEYEYIRYAA